MASKKTGFEKIKNLGISEIVRKETEQCCSSKSIYEISYNHISRKWLICNECVELDFFKNGIKEKVKISK